MADRGEVMKGLDCCSAIEPKCKECPFLFADDGKLTCIGELINAAKEVLKEREAVRPKRYMTDPPKRFSVGACGKCGYPVYVKEHFCCQCGTKAAWDECTEEEFDFMDRGATDETEKYWERRKAEDSEGAQ